MLARFRLPLRLLFVCMLAFVAGYFAARREVPAKVSQDERAALTGAKAGSRSSQISSSPEGGVPGAIFTFAQPANAAVLDAALPAPADAINYVRLDAALIAGKHSPFWRTRGEGRVVLPLPEGGALTVVIDDSEMLGADRWTSTGHLDGRPQSRAVFAWNGGFLHATISDAQLGSFALRAATEEFSQFYRIDSALVPPCGGERRVSVEKKLLPADAARPRAGDAAQPSATTAAPDIAAATNPQAVEVHVMMAYTDTVLTTLTGAARTAALQSAFDAEIAKVNAAFAASQITARVKLVKIAETHYDENASFPTGVQNDALTSLQSATDGKMDDLLTLRDQVGADAVCLALNRPDAFSSGLGFVLDTPGDNFNANFAFSVVQYTALAGTQVVPHELGHNFGCAHDRQNALGPGAYAYSYGYRFTASDGVQYHDIMAYPPGVTLAYFSNPRLSAPPPAPANTPGGIPTGAPGESDTARTIEEDAFEVASYRLQTQAAPNPGTLINVATRAYVGTGEQVLIGGLTVAGSTPKKILLRAAGPALRAFGLADALAAPVLELYSGATLLSSNTNWTFAPNASDISAAAAQSGAFAFSAASADSALLVTLPPGSYTAIVRGANGATGSALLEVYEVGAASNRIVNLSTRGYADNVGKQMYAGFVVSGAPGATKRILVRVLGPSLGKLGIATPLNDPFMEVRNAAGDLLITNDDWSTGTTLGSASAANDFSPLVKYYKEQQIAATGLAPGNRREPCLLLDLPPGNYTVVVRPFEQRDPDPARDEPAAPGVGLVEVFEINP